MTDAANLWQFLQNTHGAIAVRHRELERGHRLAVSVAAKSRDAARARQKAAEVDGLARRIKDCERDATAFNCCVSLFTKTAIYRQLLDIKATKFMTNHEGACVKKLLPDELAEARRRRGLVLLAASSSQSPRRRRRRRRRAARK